jgi:hypothetical protein
VAEKDAISMPELAGELNASGVKADPASLSRWLIRNGLSFKKEPSGEPNAIGRRGASLGRLVREVSFQCRACGEAYTCTGGPYLVVIRALESTKSKASKVIAYEGWRAAGCYRNAVQ